MNTKDECYHFNRDENIVRFYPSKNGKNGWRKKLHSSECFFAGLYVVGGLYFHGKISVQRFLVAMQATLPYFDFLYGRIHHDKDELFTIYSNKKNEIDNYFLQLEIEERQGSVSNAIITSILPEKIDPRMRAIPPGSKELNNLPVGIFKLTVLDDGFTLSYLLNHVFFDQSSIVYFLKYLSCVYSKGSCELKKPVFNDLYSTVLDISNPIIFKDLFNFLTFGESFNLKYVTEHEKYKIYAYQTIPYDGVVANLNFKRNSIRKLIEDSDDFISENDIIHAVLFKIFATNFDLQSTQNFNCYFLANMRKKCGFEENLIGNMLVPWQISLTSEYISQMSIQELAKFNRKVVSKIHGDKIKDLLIWFDNLQRFNKNAQDFIGEHYTLGSHTWFISNWTSFDYKNIKFDDAFPYSLKTLPTPPQGRTIIICFDDLDNEEVLTTSIGVPVICLNSVIEISQKSNLFSLKIN